MEFKNVLINLQNGKLLQLPLNQNQNQRQIIIDPNQFQNPDVMLICYKIHLNRENQESFAYLFKNINPIGIWYKMNIRDGDRLVSLNGQDVSRISYENVYSLMIEEQNPFTCEVIWHPELYIEFGSSMIKNIDSSIISQSDILKGKSYEQLTRILRDLLDYHPNEPCKLFKKISNQEQTESYLFPERQSILLSNQLTMEGNPDETMRNLLELNNSFEQMGIGLNRDEIYWIWLSMKGLLNDKIVTFLGAFTFGDRKKFQNIYIGWGIKNVIESTQANMIDIFPENEYELQLIEIDDPTIEEENELFQSSLLLSPNDDEDFEEN